MFVDGLTNMRAWLDRAAAEGNEASLMEASLAPDMRPLPSPYQMASDSAKNALARLTGTEAPPMPDTESSFALPNFFLHATTAYAIPRNAGIALGKPDFLQHLGRKNST